MMIGPKTIARVKKLAKFENALFQGKDGHITEFACWDGPMDCPYRASVVGFNDFYKIVSRRAFTAKQWRKIVSK